MSGKGPAPRGGWPRGAGGRGEGKRQLVELYLGGEPFEFWRPGHGFDRTLMSAVPECGAVYWFALRYTEPTERYVVERVEPARSPAVHPDGPHHPARVHLRREGE